MKCPKFNKSFLENGLVFLGIFCFLFFFYRNAFVAAEQMGAFFFDREFFNFYLATPGYLCLYGSLFLTQFFFMKWIALVCTSLIFWGIYMQGRKIFSGFGIGNGIVLWALFPVVVLLSFSDINDMLLPLALALLLNLALFLGLKKIKCNAIYSIALALALIISYWVSGGFMWCLGAWILIDIYLGKEAIKSKFQKSISGIFVMGVLPACTLYLIPDISIVSIYLNLLPYPEATSFYFYGGDFTISGTSYFLYLALGVFGVGAFYRVMDWGKIKLPNWGAWIIKGIVWASYIFVLWFFYPVNTSLLAKWDVLVNEEKWDELLESCDDFWKDREDGEIFFKKANIGTDYWGATYTKLALIMTHQLNQKYFNYITKPQMAPLFLNNEKPDIYFFSRFLYLMGDTVGAFHYATLDQSSKWKIPLATTKLLALGNVRVGNYDANDVILNRLEKTLRYRDFAKKYRNRSLYTKSNLYSNDLELKRDAMELKKRKIVDGKVTEVVVEDTAKRKIETSNFVATVIDARISELALENPKNRLAAEYLFCIALLKKDISFVFGSLIILKDLGYTQMPIHVEEAALIALNYNQPNSPYNGKTIMGAEFYGFSFRQETLARFDYFVSKYQKMMNSQMSQDDFSKEFGGTYWYYYLFGEPTF